MANLIAANDIWEARFVCLMDDQVSVNRLFYQATLTLGQGGLDTELAKDLSANFAPLYKNLLSSNAEFRGVSVQRAFPQPRTLAAIETVDAGPGLVGGNPLPAQAAGLVTLRTAFAGRDQRGRKYLPFPGGNNNDISGDPDPGYVASLNTIGLEFIKLITVAGPGGLAVDNTTLAPVIWRPPAGVAKTITSQISRLRWATQRRRSEITSGDVAPF